MGRKNSSEIVSDDDRKVELVYKNKSNQVENIEFDHKAYIILKQLIPSKELKRIINLKTINTNESPKQLQPQNIKVN